MGGRWYITTIQVTFVLKDERSEEDVEVFLKELRERYIGRSPVMEILLDDFTTKDVEV